MKYFFYLIDLITPRAIAFLPYNLAFIDLKGKINKIDGCNVWYRNSCLKGNFVVGLSDLDLTIIIHNYESEKIRKIKAILEKGKMNYPYLGEINFYAENDFLFFQKSLNSFEGNRDPQLLSLLSVHHKTNSNVEKIVFLLRMLYSDKENLLVIPKLRQKKWRMHFDELGLEKKECINFNVISKEIIHLCNTPKLAKPVAEVFEFLSSQEFNENEIFSKKTPFLWKFLFPHRHLWFETETTEDFSLIQNTIFREICLRQIDWEIWGIMSQLPFLNDKKGIETHLSRLYKVARELEDETLIQTRISKLIQISNDLSL